MTRIISLLALASLLQACSAVKIVYNQAPDLAYWYLDGYVDFSEKQSLQVKEDLARLLAWHRQTQLPGYIDTLQKLQRQMPADMDAAQACEMFFDVRRKLLAVSTQAEPAVLALAGTLEAGQLAQMEHRFAKGNTDYREDFVEGTPKARRHKRYKQAVNRAEMLYGRLGDKQLGLIGQAIDQSRFDAALSYAERVRRQQDALQTLRTLAANRSTAADTPEKTRDAMRALFERSLNSPDAVYRDYLEKLTQDNCKNFADLHNSTTPAQRLRAVETLNSYEQDLRTLAALNKG
ncbi:MAG: DUF6279 family lipoprotein [Pseudomonadota bacterium]